MGLLRDTIYPIVEGKRLICGRPLIRLKEVLEMYGTVETKFWGSDLEATLLQSNHMGCTLFIFLNLSTPETDWILPDVRLVGYPVASADLRTTLLAEQ